MGFTDLSAVLTPELVMDMLNRLYTAFDRITLKHGLFKVETIGGEPRRFFFFFFCRSH